MPNIKSRGFYLEWEGKGLDQEEYKYKNRNSVPGWGTKILHATEQDKKVIKSWKKARICIKVLNLSPIIS